MKTQLNKKTCVIIIVGTFLLISGCRTDENQNQANKDAAGQTNSSETAPTKPPPVLCSSTSQKEIQDDIDTNLRNPLKEQFDLKNITFTYQNNTLTFNGFVDGNGVVIEQLTDFFDKYRSEGCAIKVLFKGRTSSDVFEWRSTSPAPTPPADCEGKVAMVINNSPLAAQPDFHHFYNPDNKELYLWGIAKDKPSNGKLNSFFKQLQALMRNGCIDKIIFADPNGKAGTESAALLRADFLWSVCEPPNGCEQNGLCVPCTVVVNTNANSNSNANSGSNNP